MNLQEILGDAFKEDMSIEDINTALSGKKLADLSTGAYVDKNKYEADIKAKDVELQKKEEALSAKLSDDEKLAAAQAAKDARLQELEELLKNQTINGNRSKAESLTSDFKSILGIEANDDNYSSFINNISNDSEISASIASYVNKAVKDAYEKGKKDATKDNLGNFSNGVDKSGASVDKVGVFGKKLASSTTSTVDPNLYFKNNK